jgi:hypothetical protein
MGSTSQHLYWELLYTSLFLTKADYKTPLLRALQVMDDAATSL